MMIALTMPLFILLIMSNGHVYGYPPVPLYAVSANRWPIWKSFSDGSGLVVDHRHHLQQHPFSPDEINEKNQVYFDHPEKRLIDF